MFSAESITVSELKRVFLYNRDTGVFCWKESGKGRRADLVAGTKNNWGYIQIRYRGRIWQAHRLAWVWVYGTIPNERIDHKNRIRDDNRIDNLRLASNRDNTLNSARFDDKPPNEIGTTFHKQTGKWQAQICLRGQDIYLGLFKSREQAGEVYRTALANSLEMDP